VNKTDFGCFVKYGISPKQKVSSFPVSPSALLLPGKYNFLMLHPCTNKINFEMGGVCP
jgi:hypothetical protein